MLLGAVPHWAIRTSQGMLFAMVLIGLMITWFVRYPEQIVAPISLASRATPSSVVAQSSGLLILRVTDNQEVRSGQLLGHLESPASIEDVLRLSEALRQFRSRAGLGGIPPIDLMPFRTARLGELAEPYTTFEQDLLAYQLWTRQGATEAQRAALSRQIAEHEELIARSRATGVLLNQEVQIARARYQADSVLAARELVSVMEYQARRGSYIALQREVETAAAARIGQEIRLGELRDELRRTEQGSEQGLQTVATAVERSASQLWQRIAEWERRYVFRAPLSGRVALNRYWANHQFVNANDEVLSIVPETASTVHGFMRAPMAGSGKLHLGQQVRIAIDEYPSAEYGELIGTVSRISPIVRDSAYRVTVALSNGLTTTSGWTMPSRHEYRGSAVVATRDRRLLDRLFVTPVLGLRR